MGQLFDLRCFEMSTRDKTPERRNCVRKNLPYLLISLLAAVALSCTLCACDEQTTSQLPDDYDGYVIDSGSILKYQVVRSDYAEGDLVQCGIDVRYAFIDAGYELKITTDFYREGSSSFTIGEYEILVGETNRPETAEFLDGLQMWQYGYALIGEKIVIAGHDDSTTRLAVDEFCDFVASNDSFVFSEKDNYVHGDIKEGVGRIYSILTCDLSKCDETTASAEVAEYAPDFFILQNATDTTAEEYAPAGYAVGADYMTDERHDLMYYNTETYTYSSAGRLFMSQLPMLSDSEKGEFSYCVVRSTETKEKYVICSADLSSVSEEDIRERLKIFGSFADNCEDFPILFAGSYDGAAGSDTCGLLTDYGFADIMRLSSETSGECTDNYLYVSYDNIAGVKAVATEHGIYAEFQRADG